MSGWRKPISTWPFLRRPISSALGEATLATTSPSKPSPIEAPASWYSSSEWRAPAPAPGLHGHVDLVAGEALHDLGHEGDPALALGGFLWN